jgi:hypothetical protein
VHMAVAPVPPEPRPAISAAYRRGEFSTAGARTRGIEYGSTTPVATRDSVATAGRPASS